MQPRVSVIIVTWNARSLLERFLPSVAATTYPNVEIVVADNASEDDSVDFVRSAYPDIRIVRHSENLAFCAGNNAVIRDTTGEYVVLLNNDVEVEPDWLQPLVARAEADKSVGALQPKVLQADSRGKFEYAGAAGGHLDLLGFPFALGRLFDTLETDRGQYDTSAQIFWASGAAFFARRSALNRVGLLDEQFYMHMEEIDLCWRMQRHGYRIFSVPESKVYHLGGGSLSYNNPDKLYYNVRNSLVMLHKNLPQSAIAKVMELRARLDRAAWLRMNATLKFKHASAITRARKDAQMMIEKMGSIRTGDTFDVLPSYRGSIVADYFIKRKKYFAQLEKTRFKFANHPAPED